MAKLTPDELDKLRVGVENGLSLHATLFQMGYKVDDINAEGLSRLATKYLKTSKLSNTQSMIDKLNNDLKSKKVCTFILDTKALSGKNLTAAQVADIVFWARKVDTTCPA